LKRNDLDMVQAEVEVVVCQDQDQALQGMFRSLEQLQVEIKPPHVHQRLIKGLLMEVITNLLIEVTKSLKHLTIGLQQTEKQLLEIDL